MFSEDWWWIGLLVLALLLFMFVPDAQAQGPDPYLRRAAAYSRSQEASRCSDPDLSRAYGTMMRYNQHLYNQQHPTRYRIR